MLPLSLPGPPSALKLLFLGAHSDDIEIGCGGTALRLLSEHPGAEVTWVVFSAVATPEREREARAGAALFLQQARRQRVITLDFRDGYFPYDGARIKDAFEQLKSEIDPHLIFTHHRDDRHQDHRIISDLTWNTWRNHLIFEYEIPKYDGDLGTPNCFVPLTPAGGALKVKHILDVFRSQRGKSWMTEDALLALMRLRGLECAAPDKYAEAFHCRKFVAAVGAPPLRAGAVAQTEPENS